MQPALPAAVPCVRGALQPRRFLLLFFDPAKIQDFALHPSFPHRPNLALLLRFSRSCGYFLCTGRFCAVLGLKILDIRRASRNVSLGGGCLPYLALATQNLRHIPSVLAWLHVLAVLTVAFFIFFAHRLSEYNREQFLRENIGYSTMLVFVF